MCDIQFHYKSSVRTINFLMEYPVWNYHNDNEWHLSKRENLLSLTLHHSRIFFIFIFNNKEKQKNWHIQHVHFVIFKCGFNRIEPKWRCVSVCVCKRFGHNARNYDYQFIRHIHVYDWLWKLNERNQLACALAFGYDHRILTT